MSVVPSVLGLVVLEQQFKDHRRDLDSKLVKRVFITRVLAAGKRLRMGQIMLPVLAIAMRPLYPCSILRIYRLMAIVVELEAAVTEFIRGH